MGDDGGKKSLKRKGGPSDEKIRAESKQIDDKMQKVGTCVFL
jgi:hypothetical protein